MLLWEQFANLYQRFEGQLAPVVTLEFSCQPFLPDLIDYFRRRLSQHATRPRSGGVSTLTEFHVSGRDNQSLGKTLYAREGEGVAINNNSVTDFQVSMPQVYNMAS